MSLQTDFDNFMLDQLHVSVKPEVQVLKLLLVLHV